MSRTQTMPMKKPETTKGQPTPLYHPDDWDMLLGFKRHLAGLLVTSDTANFGELAARVGLTAQAISYFFRTDFQNALSRQQRMADMVGMRLDAKLLDLPFVVDEELELMEKMAAPRGNHKWQRILLNEYLIRAREAAGLSEKDVAERIGILTEAFMESEQRSDWVLPGLFRRVRAIGGRLQFDLVECD